MATVTGSQRLLTLSLNSITVGGGSVTSSAISNWNTAYNWGNHASAGYLTSVPNLDASKITTGTFSTARIPNLSASKITSGTFNAARIPDLSGTYAVTGHNHNGVYEPAFSKNNAFNKSFGTTAGTVAQGNDSRINNGQTAYGWGNHASAGYLTSLPSHNHDGRYYTESEADSRFVNVTGDTMTGVLTASGGITGLTLSNGISGSNFNITGVNQISINDPGEGIYFGGGSNNVNLYAIDDSADNKMNFGGANQLQVNGRRVFEANYHPNADKWTTARTHTVTLTGDVSGTASQSVDGTGNKTWSITTVVANDSHTHDGRYFTEAESDARYLRKDQGNANWTRLGYGDGGTAYWHKLAEVTINGSYKDYQLRCEWTDRYNHGFLNIHIHSDNDTTADVWDAYVQQFGKTNRKSISHFKYYQSGSTVQVWIHTQGWREFDYIRRDAVTEGEPAISWYNVGDSGASKTTTEPTGLTTFADYSPWHLNNDGSGSGLDADRLDGNDSAYYRNYNNLTNKPSIPSVGNGTLTVTAGTSLSGGGSFTANQSNNSSVTLNVATPGDAPASWQDVVGWNGSLIKDTAVEIHGSGYLRASYLNMTHGVGTRSSDTIFYSSNDDYIRKTNATGMRASLDVYTKGEVNNLIPTSLPANGGNADTVDGVHAHGAVRNNQANKLVRTDGNGYIQAGWINTTSGNNGTTTISRIYASQDGYIRYYTPANFGAQISSHINYNNITNKPISGAIAKGTNQNYVASSTSTSNRGNYGAGLWAYSGYSNGTNRPHTYDATLQVMPDASRGFEISADWVSQTGTPLKVRSLRDCCQGWSDWTTIWTSATDGAGSGLDADLLDGQQGSYYRNYNNLTNKPTIPDTSNLVTTNTAQTISGAKTFTANVGVSGNISANFYAFNGAYVNATSDVRAPIFYDRNNTAFYVHADGESVLGNVRANDFRLSTGNGKGVRFWNSNSYKIYMSSTGDTSWGGRAPYESTSDYNMYFRMTGGTNRGFVFRNNTTNVAGIDSAGNFNTNGIIKTGNGAASAPAYSFTSDYDSGMFSIGSNAVGFATGGTQRFKINSNGLLLTGTSSLWVNGQQTITNTRDIANVVNYQNTDGHMQLHRTGAAPLIVNRKGTTGSSGTSRGEIVNFKSANTKIGRIGYAQPYGGLLYFATGNSSGYGVGVYHFSTSSDLRPVTHTGANNDNAMDLGATSARYDDVYATNGTIQTSDRNEKQDIQELTDAETRAAVTCKGLMRRFRWVDSVEEKGDDARYHFGAIAQDVEAAFTAEGLDAGDYGLFIRSTWWEHEGY